MTPEDFAVIGIDSATVLAVWSWGFGSVILTWFFGYVIGVVLDMIKKL
jgi:hypothetical protein